MTTSRRLAFVLFSILGSLAACGKDDGPAPSATPSVSPGAPASSAAATGSGSSKYALAADPKGGVSVLEAKKQAASGPKKDVVVVGRVRTISAGFAAFTLIDASMQYCGETEKEDNCPEPWDYCCHTSKEIAENSLAVSVKVKGEIVELAKIPEFRNLDLVVVTGSLVKEKDDVILEATGWYRRERPNLPASVTFPQ